MTEAHLEDVWTGDMGVSEWSDNPKNFLDSARRKRYSEGAHTRRGEGRKRKDYASLPVLSFRCIKGDSIRSV